jgi:phosphohistidine phosphatase
VRVTLIRHAEAGDDAPRDESRALTLKGRADARRLGRALDGRGVRFSLVVTSPLVRAVQTAEIVAAAVRYRRRVTVSDLLVPEGAVSKVIAFLRTASAENGVALIAHEPILSAIAAALTGRPRYPALRKAEALRIRMPDGVPGTGQLRWRVDGATGHRDRLR